MNGRTAKRLRKATLGELARKHLRKQWPIPKNQTEFDHQWSVLYKGLKRLWKNASDPKSLSPDNAARTPRMPRTTLPIGYVSRSPVLPEPSMTSESSNALSRS